MIKKWKASVVTPTVANCFSRPWSELVARGPCHVTLRNWNLHDTWLAYAGEQQNSFSYRAIHLILWFQSTTKQRKKKKKKKKNFYLGPKRKRPIRSSLQQVSGPRRPSPQWSCRAWVVWWCVPRPQLQPQSPGDSSHEGHWSRKTCRHPHGLGQCHPDPGNKVLQLRGIL